MGKARCQPHSSEPDTHLRAHAAPWQDGGRTRAGVWHCLRGGATGLCAGLPIGPPCESFAPRVRGVLLRGSSGWTCATFFAALVHKLYLPRASIPPQRVGLSSRWGVLLPRRVGGFSSHFKFRTFFQKNWAGSCLSAATCSVT